MAEDTFPAAEQRAMWSVERFLYLGSSELDGRVTKE